MRRIWSVSARTLSAATALATVAAGLAVSSAPSARAATTYGYVNMGDSLSSGEGTYNYVSGTNSSGSNICHRSPQSYSAQFAAISVTSWSLTNVACSGAGTYDIYGTSNPNTGGNPDAGEPSQDSALSSATRLVTVSIGINDLGLINFAINCYSQLTQGAEDSCFTGIPNSTAYKNNLAALPSELDAAYSDIRFFAPNATVAVLNYPQIYPSTYSGACQEFPTSLGPQWLVTSQNMLNTAHSLVNELNSTIATEVAKYPNFILVDESGALGGHDVCSSTPWANQINGVNIIGGTADDESLHPTARGYQAMAAVLAARLDPGYFSNLSQDSAIHSAYDTDGGLAGFGWPNNNGGGTYVHYWTAAQANVQDFSGGSFGPAIFVDGPDGTYFVNYGFRTSYVSGNYASTCLAPTDNAYSYAGGTRQDFINCYMTWTSAGGVVVHGPNPATCTDYGGGTITGPNACIGWLGTAPPPGKPASGNVWFSGGGVGLHGQEIWTYGNGTVATSTARYSLSGLNTLKASQLQAYIPNNYSDASHAHYHFCTPSGGCADGYVNQNNFTNAWATFGTVCSSDGTATITLADDGGDVYPAIVGADAIRAIPTGISCAG